MESRTGSLNQHIFKVIPELARRRARAFCTSSCDTRSGDLADSDAAHGLAMKHINRGPVRCPRSPASRRSPSKSESSRRSTNSYSSATTSKPASKPATTSPPALRASALDALANAETDDDLHAAWSRVHSNWGALTDHPDSIDALRSSILALPLAACWSSRISWKNQPRHLYEESMSSDRAEAAKRRSSDPSQRTRSRTTCQRAGRANGLAMSLRSCGASRFQRRQSKTHRVTALLPASGPRMFRTRSSGMT